MGKAVGCIVPQDRTPRSRDKGFILHDKPTILPSSSATICLDLSSEPSQRMKVLSFIEDPFTSTRHRNRARVATFADFDARRHGGGYFFHVGDDADHAPCFTAQLL